MNAWWAQSRAEVRMTLRRGETLLLTVGIPVLLLVFFSLTKVVSTPTKSRGSFAPVVATWSRRVMGPLSSVSSPKR